MQALNVTSFWNRSSFMRCENCERFCFTWNLSAFASRFQHSRKFFRARSSPSPPLGQEVTVCLCSAINASGTKGIAREHKWIHVSFNLGTLLEGPENFLHPPGKPRQSLKSYDNWELLCYPYRSSFHTRRFKHTYSSLSVEMTEQIN